ncbi:MAG: hypothetical protein DHS20C20_29060 [Ardenticatenaceae bacterium]|nr:MAG: hypothetical protein DHS20C20_29060 [Ardenticatenaceae bacterium]
MTDFRNDFDDDLNSDLDDDFSAFRDDIFGDDEGSSLAEDLPPIDDLDDEFDQLRRKSARGESLDDDLASDEEFFSDESSGGGGFAWRNFTPGQRLILALLVFLNMVMGVIGLLVITGNLG